MDAQGLTGLLDGELAGKGLEDDLEALAGLFRAVVELVDQIGAFAGAAAASGHGTFHEIERFAFTGLCPDPGFNALRHQTDGKKTRRGDNGGQA